MIFNKLQYITLIFFILFLSKSNIMFPQDTIKTKIGKFLNFNDSLLHFNYRSLTKTQLNAQRINLLIDHFNNPHQYLLNKSVQKYFSEHITEENTNIQTQYIQLSNHLYDNTNKVEALVSGFVSTRSEKEILLSIWRKDIVKVESEQEMISNIQNNTRSMIDLGYDDLGTDLFPFITMLMWEQKIHHYQSDRVVSTKAGSKGIVSSIQIFNALETLDNDVKAGVCRDVHDWGLRMLRPMMSEYYNAKYPDMDYNPDDYIFLQAWVTPSSQHITIAVVDPENTRNYHELDWGRVLKKENQEGVEIGKMVGTTVRLWKYNPQNNVTQAFNLLRTQWGTYLDRHFYKNDEDWIFNGIYTPYYASSADLIYSAGKKSEVNIAIGMLNASEKSASSSFRSGIHSFNFAKIFNYNGFVAVQSMIIDDTQRKNVAMAWNKWYSAQNWVNSVRYLNRVKSKDWEILPGLKINAYTQSQLEVFLSLSYFKTDSSDFNNKLEGTGDGNIWITWGSNISYNYKNLSFNGKFASRNFLIPTDVRLLSPNPFELIKNATIANSGNDIMLRAKFNNNNWFIEPEFRYEQNKFNAQFTFFSLKFGKMINQTNQIYLESGKFHQKKGLEYYWYAKSRIWFNAGINSFKQNFQFSIYSELIENDFPSISFQIKKYLN